MLIAAIAGEHMVLIGPPGTAKSAVIRAFSKLIDAKYFEYLLTRFSEPNELFGPVDIQGFRQGSYRRVTTGMLPEAEIVFLDEAFKANSAILNSLLTLLNERRFNNGATVTRVPLISLFAASNEVPGSDNLDAIFDRFLLRVHSDNLDSYHFHEQLGHHGAVVALGRAEVGGARHVAAVQRFAQRPVLGVLHHGDVAGCVQGELVASLAVGLGRRAGGLQGVVGQALDLGFAA